MRVDTWRTWLARNWADLYAGKAIRVLPTELAHPSISAEWREILLAEPFGQECDWALSLADGSRLHLHEYSDRWEVHRDEHDPSQGVVAALQHFAKEAPSAKLVAIAGAGLVCLKVARRILLPCFAGVLGFALASCASALPPDSVPISKECEAAYVHHVAAWAIELARACAPAKVEDCGEPKDRINAKWETTFDKWERECGE